MTTSGAGRGDGAGVVVDDAPAFGEAASDQSEDAAGSVFFASELPAAKDESGVGAERSDLEVRELQLTHGRAVGIAAAVAVEQSLPATQDAG